MPPSARSADHLDYTVIGYQLDQYVPAPPDSQHPFKVGDGEIDQAAHGEERGGSVAHETLPCSACGGVFLPDEGEEPAVVVGDVRYLYPDAAAVVHGREPHRRDSSLIHQGLGEMKGGASVEPDSQQQHP